MSEIPQIIYLQVGDDYEVGEDIGDATWCVDNVFKTDIEYRRPDKMFQQLRDNEGTIDSLRTQLAASEQRRAEMIAALEIDPSAISLEAGQLRLIVEAVVKQAKRCAELEEENKDLMLACNETGLLLDKSQADNKRLKTNMQWIADSGINGEHYQSHSSLVVLAAKSIKATP